MIYSLVISFVLTMIIETAIVKMFFIHKKILKASFLVNILTNPCVVYTYNMMAVFSFEYRNIVLVFLEIAVVFIEAYVYKLLLDISYRKAFIVSFVANMIAYITGLLLW